MAVSKPKSSFRDWLVSAIEDARRASRTTGEINLVYALEDVLREFDERS